jgi:asparagine synthetase B (glutamine-hydrolysing)
MCGLFGSRDPQKLEELFKLNTRRGQTRMSLNEFTTIPVGVDTFNRDPERTYFQGGVKSEKIELVPAYIHKGNFTLGHIQAPTAASNEAHPAKVDEIWVWHNGILKDDAITRLQEETGETSGWDTHLIATRLQEHWEDAEFVNRVLSDLEGSFACFLYDGYDLYCFRNEISPLFVDDDLNFSSVKFEGSNSIEPGIVFKIDFIYNKLDKSGGMFTTKNNPYIL